MTAEPKIQRPKAMSGVIACNFDIFQMGKCRTFVFTINGRICFDI